MSSDLKLSDLKLSEQFLTVQQVAELLMVCRVTVYRLIDTGKLAAYRVGRGSYRIEAQDVRAFLVSCRSVVKDK